MYGWRWTQALIRQLVLNGEVSTVAVFTVMQNSVLTFCPNRTVHAVWKLCSIGKSDDCGCRRESVLEIHGLNKTMFVKV